METIMLLPSLKNAKKQAFEVAKSQTGLSDVVIYPITEYIGAIFDTKEEVQLHFPKMIRKLFESDIKKFIAIWRDRINDNLFIFVSTGDDIEVFKFNGETMYAGLITAITTHYKKGMGIYCIEDEELKKILKEALPTINEANKKQGKPLINFDDIIWAQGEVTEEDYKLLVRKKSIIDSIVNKITEHFKKDKQASKKGAAATQLQLTPTTFLLLMILAGMGGYYYYENIYNAKKEEDVQKISTAEQFNRMKKRIFVQNAKGTALVLYLLQNKLPFEAYQTAKDRFFLFSADERVMESLKKIAYFSIVNEKILGGYGSIADISPKLIRTIGIRQNQKEITLKKALQDAGVSPSHYAKYEDEEYALVDTTPEKLGAVLIKLAGNGLHKEEIVVNKKNDRLSTIVTLKKVQFKNGASFKTKTARSGLKNGAKTKGSNGVLEAM